MQEKERQEEKRRQREGGETGHDGGGKGGEKGRQKGGARRRALLSPLRGRPDVVGACQKREEEQHRKRAPVLAGPPGKKEREREKERERAEEKTKSQASNDRKNVSMKCS